MGDGFLSNKNKIPIPNHTKSIGGGSAVMFSHPPKPEVRMTEVESGDSNPGVERVYHLVINNATYYTV